MMVGCAESSGLHRVFDSDSVSVCHGRHDACCKECRVEECCESHFSRGHGAAENGENVGAWLFWQQRRERESVGEYVEE